MLSLNTLRYNKKALDLCKKEGLKSIAFPNISCGVYRFPIKIACRISLETARFWVENNPNVLDEIVFVCFDPKIKKYMDSLLREE
ncbi:macro domain-containing protein [Candidatus Uabimicrobium sp. HlEnr_7]|uniref:macro domain-containing protein n=1 Tax=Candidatus Uabimicrobium helgolandensis TaxID=3095367 RepID=UPI0035593120